MPRSHGLILEDCSVVISIGQKADGSEPVFTTGVDFKVRLKELSIEDTIEKTNLKPASDGRKKHRYHSAGGTGSLKFFTKAGGFAFASPSTGTYTGRYLRLDYKPLSTLDQPLEFICVIEKWETTGSTGEGTMENLTLDMDPDYTTSA